ncbi:MAG TPA: hypothetical protein VFB36_04865 [Nevskiaceae bacterium]|nr:hypothetical protein [Nevskiaceae bacterium]
MHQLIDNVAGRLCIIAAGVFFLSGLLTGAWKYFHIARSPTATAPVYVDIAHRTSLLYSFASMLLAPFAVLSAWDIRVNFLACAALITFFGAAIAGYVTHGLLRDTDNQFVKPYHVGKLPMPGVMIHGFMWILMFAEIGGFLVLFSGVIATMRVAA